MTDARYPERWLHDRRITRLSDRAHRAFVVLLAYGVANRTDGVVLLADLRDLPRYVEDEVPQLIGAGLMEPLADGTGYVVVEFVDTQSSRAELEAADAARVAARKKKAGQRAAAKERQPASPAVPGDVAAKPAACAVPGDVPGDHTGKARQGKARQGSRNGTTTEVQPEAQAGWPPVPRLGVPDCTCGWHLAPGQHEPNCSQLVLR